MTNKKVYFGAGCFWGVEDFFMNLKGVIKTRAGYMGGDDENWSNPIYEQVCSGKTGHIEVVEIVFDKNKISFEELSANFFQIHNPMSKDKQGLDIGKQYRSVIFYTTEKQKQKAEKSKNQLEKKIGRKVVTQILPASDSKFWEAEQYHQKYVQKTGEKVC